MSTPSRKSVIYAECRIQHLRCRYAQAFACLHSAPLLVRKATPYCGVYELPMLVYSAEQRSARSVYKTSILKAEIVKTTPRNYSRLSRTLLNAEVAQSRADRLRSYHGRMAPVERPLLLGRTSFRCRRPALRVAAVPKMVEWVVATRWPLREERGIIRLERHRHRVVRFALRNTRVDSSCARPIAPS